MSMQSIESSVTKLISRFMPHQFLDQYSDLRAANITLADGCAFKTQNFHRITYPLMQGSEQLDAGYTLMVKNLGSENPEVLVASFDGEHPLETDTWSVQLVAVKQLEGNYVRSDNWLSINFAGFSTHESGLYVPEQAPEPTGLTMFGVDTAKFLDDLADSF